MNRRFPRYPDDADYQTNAPSYYEDLARKNKLIKNLAKRIWEYDKILADSLEEIEEVLRQVIDKIGEDFNEEIYQLLVKWVEDGTLDHIINETLMNKKADISYVDQLINSIYKVFNENLLLFDTPKTKKYRYQDTTNYYITILPYDKYTIHLGLANNEKDTVQTATDYAIENMYEFVINAGTFNVETSKINGKMIIDNQVISNREFITENTNNLLAINNNGKLLSYPSESNIYDLLNDDIKYALNGWRTFIENYNYINKGDPENKQPLQIIGQLKNNDYIILSSDGRTSDNTGLSLDNAYEILARYETKFAYNLDGGGSVSTVNRLIKQNLNLDSLGTSERKVSNFIYFKNKKNKIINKNNDIINIYKEIAKKISVSNHNFIGGLNIKSQISQKYPGIYYYTEGSNKRSAGLLYNKSDGFILEKNYDNNSKHLFRANDEGLYDINGMLATFNNYPIYTSDVNNIKGSGFYKTNELTKNTPIIEQQGFILSLQYNKSKGNVVQIFIPKEIDNIFKRQIYSNGESGKWHAINSNAYATQYRPSKEKLVIGYSIFDTTLNKPIWWNGEQWIDSEGLNV